MEAEIAKIVGAANEKTWSQVHEFKPEGEKLKSHGQLVASLAFKAKKEGVEVSSFGTEMITRLQEMYYSNESQSILKKVGQTMESLGAEFFNEVELEIVMMVIWGEYLYAGRSGAGQVFLRREGELVALLGGKSEEAKVVSGELKAGDELVGGTSQFYRIMSEEELGEALGQELDQIRESLAAVVHGRENNSQAAAVVVKVGGEEKEAVEAGEAGVKKEVEEEVEAEKEEKEKKMELGGVKGWLAGLRKKWGKGGEIRVRQPGRWRKRQRSAATVAVVLVVVFGLSVFLAGRKRQKSRQEAEYRVVVEEVSYKYEEAMGLMELNPLRARSLLKESQGRLEEYKVGVEGELDEELKELAARIEEALGQAQREYELESADEWFDFGLVKEGFKGSDWEAEENEVMVWDEEAKTVLLINLETKASRVVVGGEKVGGGRLTGLAGDRGMVVGKDLVTVVEMEEGEIVAEIGADEWGRIVDGVGFSSNLYLLDGTEEGQIWKYLGVKSGLSSKRSYLKGESYDLSEAVSMAIDGSVWVLFSDGTIVKYTRGQKDVFGMTGLDKEFEEAVKIFTTPEVENIYVLDHKQTRVVVISKTGEYKAQYIWPGIAGVKDLVVSEELGKIFLLTREKIFTIDLR